MSGILITLLMWIQIVAPQTTTPPDRDEIKETLARAEALYFEARFNDSIQLLINVNEQLQARPERIADRINVKLQMALASIGLNDTEKAKSFLVEMYMLDSDAVLDSQQFSPKVIALAGDAKATSIKIKCQVAGDEARNNLKQGNAAALIGLLSAPATKCVDMAALGPEAAEVLYKAGMESYKNSDYGIALQDFQAALKYSPKHEMANQYIDLAQGKLQIAEDRAVIQFQKDLDARNFPEAAAGYQKITAFNDVKLAPTIRQANDQYRKVLSSLVDNWNQVCPSGDANRLGDIRNQVNALLPDPSFGEDIRARMMTCTKPELKAEVQPVAPAAGKTVAKPEVKPEVKPELKPVSLTGSANPCLQLDYRVAMTRLNLKTRVDPDIPREARPYLQGNSVTIRVRVRIDETGNVVSTETPGGNPLFNTAVRNAVEHWKFSSAMDASGARCVDTEIPIAIGPLNSR